LFCRAYSSALNWKLIAVCRGLHRIDIHANDARHWRGHGIRPEKKFREKQGPRALLLKHFLGAPYTRIQFQRNPAQHLENFDSFCPAEFIPDGIRGNRAQQA
jgi:hypothetical protein